MCHHSSRFSVRRAMPLWCARSSFLVSPFLGCQRRFCVEFTVNSVYAHSSKWVLVPHCHVVLVSSVTISNMCTNRTSFRGSPKLHSTFTVFDDTFVAIHFWSKFGYCGYEVFLRCQLKAVPQLLQSHSPVQRLRKHKRSGSGPTSYFAMVF